MNSLSLTGQLSNNLNYDYTNGNLANISSLGRYTYRIQQTSITINNRLIPQLTVILWSGECFVCLSYSEKVINHCSV